MCGRYSLFTPASELEEHFDAAFERPFQPRYNAAPGQELPVVTGDEPDRFRRFEWGLVPSWADESGSGLINARAETLSEKPSFREAFERRRCLVPADGFYEWVDREGDSQPYRVTLTDDRPFAMAGLWERWRPPQRQTGLDDFADGDATDGEPDVRETFTVVTTEPNALVDDLHHRMAVILPPDRYETWLTADTDAAADLLEPYPAAEMEAYPVSTAVNDPTNDSPELIERA